MHRLSQAGRVKQHSSHLQQILPWYPSVVSAGTGAICLLIARACFPYLAFDPDSAAYLFQAKLLAQGVLAADAPPEFGLSSSPHIDIYNGLWFAKYPFGNSLFLAPGVLAGAPSIMPAVATCLTLLLFFAIVEELFDRRVAALALLLAAFSPATLVMGSTLLSQPTSRLFIALFFWSLLRAVARARSGGGMLYGAIAGLALGYDFNTRPLVAVVCGFASLILLAQAAVRTDAPLRILRPTAVMAVTVLLMIGLFFAWNAHLTGDPLLLPYNALQAADRMGFGLRGEGYAPLIAEFRVDFTPAIALNRLWQHTLPAVLFNLAGWGTYHPGMLLPDPAHVFPAAAWLLLVPAALIVVALLQTTGRVDNLFCASVFLFTLISLFFQYSDHSTWGSTPLNTSYYSEAILFGLTPLLARGMLAVYDIAKRVHRKLVANVLVAACAALFANAAFTDAVFVRVFKHWDPYYQLLPRLVDDAKLRNAVVFVPNSRDAPVGEYPFVPLDQASVVYFRTGPLPHWRLDTPDWRTAYRKYFSGRSAYLFDQMRLHRLDTSATPPAD